MAIVPLAGALGMALSMPVSASANSPPTCNTTTIFVNVNTGDEIKLPTFNGNPTCQLAEGNAGSPVAALQDALDFCYNAGIQVDGKFGPLTKGALENAQRKEGFPANEIDGIYGPFTRDRLDWRNLSGRTRCIGLDGTA